MLRCLAGICGGDGSRGEKPAAADAGGGETKVVEKPLLQVGAEYAPKVSSLESMVKECPEEGEISAAPPGIDPPYALVGGNFRKNSSRLLVVLPCPGSPWGTWDGCLGEGRGDSVPLVRWALANGYAVAVMNGKALQEDPTRTWDEIMRGSPARFVAIVSAGDAIPYLRQALMPQHPMLYGRLRAIFVSPAQVEAPAVDLTAAGAADVQQQLDNATVQLPEEWLRHSASMLHQCMFQLFEQRFARWGDAEMKKYLGFQGMKENDMPGLKRMPLDVRIKRMDRDRADDELARLLKKNEENAFNICRDNVDEDEPGVD